METGENHLPDTLTIAFTDIVDSTAKSLAIGDAAYVKIAAEHDALIRSIAAPAELKTIGDSFMLRFDASDSVSLHSTNKALPSPKIARKSGRKVLPLPSLISGSRPIVIAFGWRSCTSFHTRFSKFSSGISVGFPRTLVLPLRGATMWEEDHRRYPISSQLLVVSPVSPSLLARPAAVVPFQ